jgi:hypothetical protein
LPDSFINLEQKHQVKNNSIGLLRNAMMYEDIRKYFEKSWRTSWTGFDEKSVALLSEKYGQNMLNEIISKYDLDVFNEDDLDVDYDESIPDELY